MNDNKEIEKLEKLFTFEELAKLSISISRRITSISPQAFDEWTDSPNNPTEDSAKKKDVLLAQNLLKQNRENILSAISQHKIKSLLIESISNESRARKLDIVLEILDSSFPEIITHSETSLASIPIKLGHVKNDEEFYSQLPETIYSDDRIFLAKSLLKKEFEHCAFNEDWIKSQKIFEENRCDFNFSDDIGSEKCSVCENDPCLCSDPQHNS